MKEGVNKINFSMKLLSYALIVLFNDIVVAHHFSHMVSHYLCHYFILPTLPTFCVSRVPPRFVRKVPISGIVLSLYKIVSRLACHCCLKNLTICVVEYIKFCTTSE